VYRSAIFHVARVIQAFAQDSCAARIASTQCWRVTCTGCSITPGGTAKNRLVHYRRLDAEMPNILAAAKYAAEDKNRVGSLTELIQSLDPVTSASFVVACGFQPELNSCDPWVHLLRGRSERAGADSYPGERERYNWRGRIGGLFPRLN